MSFLPPPRTPLDIDGPAGTLEALLENPGGDGTRFAVVCHPHPLHGGGCAQCGPGSALEAPWPC